jgi:hypothetical protein
MREEFGEYSERLRFPIAFLRARVQDGVVARGSVLGTLAALALLAGAAPAQAATTFGSTLAGTPGGGLPANDVLTQLTGNGISATAPSSGVVTAIRVKHGTSTPSPGLYAYRILTGDGSGASPSFTARPATASGQNDTFLSWRPSFAVTEVYFPTDASGQRVGIPIAAGERIALWSEKQADGSAAPSFVSTAGGTAAVKVGDHVSGTATYFPFGSAVEALIQGTLEPDADGDHFGDESQDLCPGLAGSGRGCPPGTVFTTTQGTTQVVQVVQTSVSGLAQFGAVSINKDRSKLSVGVSCPAGRSQSCQGTTSAETAGKIALHAGSAKSKVLKLGKAKFKIKSGASKTLTIKISSANRKRVKSLKRLRLKLTLTESSSSKKTL